MFNFTYIGQAGIEKKAEVVVGGGGGQGLDDDPYDVPWEQFVESTYIDKKRLKPGEDAYGKNKFNQKASDDTHSNRNVPDTRHAM